MRLYLTPSSIPALDGVGRKARRQAMQFAFWRAVIRPVPVVALLGMVVFFGAVEIGISEQSLGLPRWIRILNIPTAMLYGSCVTHFSRPFLREFLGRKAGCRPNTQSAASKPDSFEASGIP